MILDFPASVTDKFLLLQAINKFMVFLLQQPEWDPGALSKNYVYILDFYSAPLVYIIMCQ